MITRYAVACCLYLLGLQQSEAASFALESGNSLHALCSNPLNSPPGNSCGLYIIGAVDALLLAQDQQHRRDFCPAQEVTTGQFVGIVKNYLDAHPETWQFSASSEIFVALKRAFPCPK